MSAILTASTQPATLTPLSISFAVRRYDPLGRSFAVNVADDPLASSVFSMVLPSCPSMGVSVTWTLGLPTRSLSHVNVMEMCPEPISLLSTMVALVLEPVRLNSLLPLTMS